MAIYSFSTQTTSRHPVSRAKLALCGTALLVALALYCENTAQAQAQDAPDQDTPIAVSAKGFTKWMQGFSQRALEYGISPELVERVRMESEFLPRVLRHDRNQPEFTITLAQYTKRIVSPSRINNGSQQWKEHRDLLEKVHSQYGVPPRYLLAFWGIESSYGKHTGKYPVISSLATLSYDHRRSQFFEKQLLHALTIVDRKMIDYESMLGAWAGAMGQVQFIPSSYLSYAVDEDNDGKRDLWNSLPDILASAGNYLKENGWQADGRWGYAVQVADSQRSSLAQKAQNKTRQPFAQWASHGVILPAGTDSLAKAPTRIIMPEGEDGAAFLVFANFDTILRWNRSEFYAIAVGLLANSFSNPNLSGKQ